jgi:hypothetical protein
MCSSLVSTHRPCANHVLIAGSGIARLYEVLHTSDDVLKMRSDHIPEP